MKLWLLERVDLADYDEYRGFVIRAESEEAARALCPHGDEGERKWLDPAQSTCVELTCDGEREVILGDFHAG